MRANHYEGLLQACPAFWRLRQLRIAVYTQRVQAELARRGLADEAGRHGGPPRRACAACGVEFRSFRLDRCQRCRGHAHTPSGGR